MQSVLTTDRTFICWSVDLEGTLDLVEEWKDLVRFLIVHTHGVLERWGQDNRGCAERLLPHRGQFSRRSLSHGDEIMHPLVRGASVMRCGACSRHKVGWQWVSLTQPGWRALPRFRQAAKICISWHDEAC